jgi:tetratricopeptide (TPR) repeat protein
MAAGKLGDAAAANDAAERLVALSNEPDQHPFAKQIITLQAKEAEVIAAQAARDTAGAIARMDEAVAIEDSISTLSQPPYPPIPAHELYGTLLMEMEQPADAMKHFTEALRRTPGRPKAIYGIARAAEALGDTQTAIKRYVEFLELWKDADKDRPEIAAAQRFLSAMKAPAR